MHFHCRMGLYDRKFAEQKPSVAIADISDTIPHGNHDLCDQASLAVVLPKFWCFMDVVLGNELTSELHLPV